jgi:cobalt-zinc-cadmium efflux system membrane fusion protein
MRWSIAVVLTALAVAACGGRSDDAKNQAPGGPGPATLFRVSPGQLKELRLARVQPAAWDTEIRTTGTVDWDADHTSQAIAAVGGVITRIAVDLGRRVKAGDPLLYVASQDLASAVATYRKALNRLGLAKRTLERSADLLAHKVIAQKDYESAQADYNDASTEVENDIDVLHVLGLSRDDIVRAGQQAVPVASELPVRSPVAGVVVQKLVSPGQLVQAGSTTCFAISNTATVWVQGHLHDSELGGVRAGDAVDVLTAAAGVPLRGKLTYVGAMLDPTTRTTPVRVVTPNPQGLLKKDQFVDLVIHTSVPRSVLTVPVSAVLYSGEDLPVVYRQVEARGFARTVIRVGEQRGGQYEVLSGLRGGDAVVAEGALFLQFAQTYEQ